MQFIVRKWHIKMRKSLNLIILLFGMLALHGCAKSEYADAYVRPEYIQKNQTSMVLARVIVPYKNVLNQQSTYGGYLVIRDVNNNAKYKIDGASYADSASMVSPGIYQIDSVGWSDGTYAHIIRLPDVELQQLNLYFGAIAVKPGECLYLGDIVVNKYTNTDHPLRIYNKTEQMVGELKGGELDSLMPRVKFYALLTDNDAIQQEIDGTFKLSQK